MKEALIALHHLQQVDSAIALAVRRMKALDDGSAEKMAMESARTAHDEASSRLHKTSADLHDAELEQKSVEDKKRDYESRLYGGRVTAFKELESMQQEIEALGRRRSHLDDRILELMDTLDLHRDEEKSSSSASTAAEAAFAAKAKAFKAATAKYTSELKVLRPERDKLAEPVAAPLLKRYEAIRVSKLGVGAARILDGICEGCKTTLPAQSIEDVVDKGVLRTCDSCGRILCPTAL